MAKQPLYSVLAIVCLSHSLRVVSRGPMLSSSLLSQTPGDQTPSLATLALLTSSYYTVFFPSNLMAGQITSRAFLYIYRRLSPQTALFVTFVLSLFPFPFFYLLSYFFSYFFFFFFLAKVLNTSELFFGRKIKFTFGFSWGLENSRIFLHWTGSPLAISVREYF